MSLISSENSASAALAAWAQALRPQLDGAAFARVAALAAQVEQARDTAADTAARETFERALGTVELLASIETDADCFAAALAAVLPRYVDDAERMRAELGTETADLVEKLKRAKQIESFTRDGAASGSAEARLEGLRKMLLAMAQDVRVVIIQLTEWLDFMRGHTKADEASRREAGRITMDLYAPLANRLGIWRLKWELEDLAFRFLEPEIYKSIAGKLDEKRVAREAYIERVMTLLREALARNNLIAQVMGRPKHIYSIYKKMRHKQLEFEDIYDVRAVRVLVNEVKDCYAGLGVVHSLWQPVPGEFDDYIAHPKGNRYRSLHTAVLGPEGKMLEVQIRTHEMHDQSELGMAAHWRYKEGRKSDRKYDEKIAWLRQVLDWKEEVAGASAFRDYRRVFEDTVYVLTPQGQIVDLPQGATPVDFAYRVHTDLGHRCRGAKVDGNIVPLSSRLANGQRVEITSAKQGGPSRDWLNPELGYLVSPRALAKVRAWFKHEQLAQAIASGRAVLEKELQRAGRTDLALDKIAQALEFAGPEDLLAAVGHGELTSRQLQQAIAPAPAAPSATPPPAAEITHAAKAPASTGGVIVLGVDNLATLVAKCCKPVPPEPIVGFVSKGRGVVVHRVDCENVRELTGERRERLMPAQWGGKVVGPFSVDIAIDANDRAGLLRDISEAMTREHVNVTGVNTLTRGDRARMFFTVELTDLVKLNQLLAALKSVPSVVMAARKRG
jgi:GTP pyrophosphokinase